MIIIYTLIVLLIFLLPVKLIYQNTNNSSTLLFDFTFFTVRYNINDKHKSESNSKKKNIFQKYRKFKTLINSHTLKYLIRNTRIQVNKLRIIPTDKIYSSTLTTLIKFIGLSLVLTYVKANSKSFFYKDSCYLLDTNNNELIIDVTFSTILMHLIIFFLISLYFIVMRKLKEMMNKCLNTKWMK